MTWDPSIILGFKQYTGPDPQETARTMSQLSLQGIQKQQAQASLADMLNQQQQAQALRQAYAQNVNSPDKLPAALMSIGAGPQAFAAQDQQSQMLTQQSAAKRLQDQGMREEFERHMRPLMGVKSDADIAAVKEAWRREGYPEENIAMLPDSYEQAAPKIKMLLGSVMPVEKQAELAQKDKHDTVMEGLRVTDTGTGQRMGYNPETGKYDVPIGAPKPQRPAGGAGGSGDTSGGLTPDVIEQEAQAYYRTHVLPSLGTGKDAAAGKRAIMARAAAIAKEQGGDLAGNAAGYKADTASLKKLQTQADFVESFESTALKNLDTAIQAAAKIPDVGGSLLNAPVRAWADKMGNVDMARHKAALTTARQEISKILSGSTGSGAVSEGQRHEVEALMGDNASFAQLKAAADILKRDMANRKTSVDESINAIRGRLGSKRASAKEGVATAGQGSFDVGSGAVTVRRKSDGKTKTLPADAAQRVLSDPAYERVK